MASGEVLRNTIGRINAIMCEASGNCLRPEIPYPTLDTIDYQTCDDVVTNNLDPDRYGPCEPFLQIFCLREGRDTQSIDTGDCPLGVSTAGIIAFTPTDLNRGSETRPGLPNGPVNRTITSQQPWPVRNIN